MAFAPNSATLPQILQSIRARIAAVLVRDEEDIASPHVFASVAGENAIKDLPWHSVAFITVTPGGFRPAESDPGAGRLARRVYRQVKVAIYSRHFRDQAGHYESAIEDEDYGHDQYELAVVDALDVENLFADDGTTLYTFEPIRLEDGNTEGPTEVSGQAGWLRSSINFEVGYNQKLTQGTPPGT